MIKYNNSNINDWNFGDDNIIKVYRNNAVCYYKITGGGDTPTAQTPCFAVVDDIFQYSDTEFEDVYNKADEKWYKLNNLNQYEQYGVYGSGRTITYYDGKLTVDDGYEYQYSGGSWVNVGEVSGSTATLPDVAFSVNYNAKNYDTNTKTLAKTSGQLVDTDAIITVGTPTVNDGYLTIASNTRATISGYQTYFNRDDSNPNLTIISKQRTEGDNCHMFANRESNYNWMYRPYSTRLTLHGGSETGSIAVTTQPVIESVRVDSSRNVKYNNYTDNTTSTTSSFSYGSTNSGKFALFAGYATSSGEWFVGDFYWVYMSQNTLTDEQVQQVIAYNEGGGGQTEYPVYYDEMQDPPNYLSFSSMTEAESYECPWWGMTGIIDNTDYLFCNNNEWLTKYVYQEVSGDYICYNGDKYKKMQEYDRNVDGTVSATTNYVIGDLIESGSTDCQASYDTMYFTMETDDGQPGTFTLKKGTSKSISYSTDDGATWSTTTSTNQTVTASKVMLKSSDTTAWYSSGDNSGMTCTSDFHVYGNIMSLVYGDNFQDKLDIPTNNQFRSLFGWSNITDATNLVMNATGATSGCYHSMFRNCYKLVSIPDIKIVATYGESVAVIIDSCPLLTGFSMSNVTAFTGSYEAYNLGYHCTNLKEVNLPSLVSFRTTGDWFSNCTNLEKIVCGATSNTNWNNYGSGSVGTVFYKNPNATWTGIPSSWIVRDMT